LIRRSSKEFIDNLLDINPNWNVLDIGCGYSAHKDAKVVCDIQDLSSFYKDKNFIKLSEGNLPFKDKEFDFVISSHVIEHVQDVALFIKELERVSSKGYIELPTVLEDNLVFENKKDHLWQMWFDDDNSKLIISKRVQFIEPILTVSSVKKIFKILQTKYGY
jgi:ubiquinone/menaquinone biosynthesis C-methylase UbiE